MTSPLRRVLLLAVPVTLAVALAVPSARAASPSPRKTTTLRLVGVPLYSGPSIDELVDAYDRAQAEAAAEAQRIADEEAEVVAEAARRAPRSVVLTAAWPSGCTAPGTFDPAPCIPRSTCVLPEFICSREAGSINVWNHGGSGASGKYQAMPGTWAGHGGYLYAAWAPESVQDEFALWLWNDGRGCGHWSACGAVTVAAVSPLPFPAPS